MWEAAYEISYHEEYQPQWKKLLEETSSPQGVLLRRAFTDNVFVQKGPFIFCDGLACVMAHDPSVVEEWEDVPAFVEL